MKITADLYKTSAKSLISLAGDIPETGIVLGSGLGELAGELENALRIPYAEIPHLPISGVEGHANEFVCGELSGKKVLLLSGRCHYYEGFSMEQVAYNLRVLGLAGVKKIILTNAAGAVNLEFRPGDIMIIEDHIKLCADSPSRGNIPDEFGAAFCDMTAAYDPDIRRDAERAAENLGFKIKPGVYAFMPGPQYETPAEICALRIMGADAVGMSTVPETIAARQMGMKVLGLSCITNMAAGITGETLSHDEVRENASAASERFKALVTAVIHLISDIY